jgi:hypothetical protein
MSVMLYTKFVNVFLEVRVFCDCKETFQIIWKFAYNIYCKQFQ